MTDQKEAPDWPTITEAELIEAIDAMSGEIAPDPFMVDYKRDTLGGMIAAVYGKMDVEDCAIVDREWARQRGYILPADGTSHVAQAAPEPLAWRWNTKADQRWRVTITRPVPTERTAFDKIDPLYASPPAQLPAGETSLQKMQISPEAELAAARSFLRDKPSTSYLQRKMQITYNRACGLMTALEREGFVSLADSQGRRTVLLPSTEGK